MGINIMGSFSALGRRKVSKSIMGVSTTSLDGKEKYAPPPPNPNPFRYHIIKWQYVNEYLLMMVKYPDATNFEGQKILLFDRGTSPLELEAQGAIDPHFSDSKRYKHPIARFEPTIRGWEMALRTCQAG